MGIAGTIKGLVAAILVGGAPLAAQDIPNPITPLQVSQDPNGVNLSTGKTRIAMPVLSVPAAPRLVYQYPQDSAPAIDGNLISGAPNYRVENFTAHLADGTTDAFQCIDYDCNPQTTEGSFIGSGSLLRTTGSSRIYFQAQTGTRYNYNYVLTNSTNGQTASKYYVSTITYADGEVITYDYTIVYYNGLAYRRPSTISSSVGYTISIAYAGNDFANDP